MKVLNDFKCPDGHITEIFAEATTTEVGCSVCGKGAVKSLSKVNAKFNATGRFATTKAKLQWEKRRERQIAHERKTNAE